ncbi:MAG: extracellular solute-binding protein [Candidatus Marinimicrobia bacterium]|nr:extracellular solute-binding protein [Candidatus Neomarinimicrobiota bacterium]MBT6472161.1 extracellular solute-binding protein [Candidatus Neomarinimicrobiota bacterium]
MRYFFISFMFILTFMFNNLLFAKEISISWPSIWVAKDSKAKVIRQLVNEFNQANSGKIKVVLEDQTDYDLYAQKLTAQLATGKLPDIFTIGSDLRDIFYRSNKGLDFVPHLDYDSNWKSRFPGNSLNSNKKDGKIYMLPYELFVTPVIYNKKLLKNAGYESFPKSYKEFIKMCKAIKKTGKICSSQMTNKNAWTSMLWYSQILVSAGGPDIYNNGLDDPAYLKAAVIMREMFNYTSSDALGATAAVSAGHFLNERSAVFMNGPWFIKRYTTEGIPGLHDNLVIAPAPMVEGGKGGMGGYIGGRQSSLAAGKQTDKNKEKAIVKFLKWLTEPDNVARLSYDSGAMFIIKTELPDDMDRLFKDMSKQAGNAPYVAPIFINGINSLSIAREFPQALSALVLDDVSPKEFVQMLKDAK